MAEDQLLHNLAQAAHGGSDDWLEDPRWFAFCAGKLSAEGEEQLRHEALDLPLGRLALEAFRPLEGDFHQRTARRLQTGGLVERCLAGETQALEELVDLLTPVIQARVARILLRRSQEQEPRNLRHEIEDLTQEMFVILFADEGKVLRSWRPDRGLSLENFAGLVSERQVTSILRSGKRNPWREDPTLTEELDEPSPRVDPETEVATRDELQQLLDALRETLSPEGWHLFDLLFLRELSVEQIYRETGKSPDAIYAWRSRLRRLARKLLADLRALEGR